MDAFLVQGFLPKALFPKAFLPEAFFLAGLFVAKPFKIVPIILGGGGGQENYGHLPQFVTFFWTAPLNPIPLAEIRIAPKRMHSLI